MITRRTLNASMAAAAALLQAAPRMAWADALEDWLLEPVPGDDRLRRPNILGKITDEQFLGLSKIYQFIASKWEMQNAIPGPGAFRDYLNAKTAEAPSYYTEYAEAVAIVRRASAELTDDEAGARILAPRAKGEQLPVTRLGRMQTWVCREIIAWQVTQGGFRRFGYVNYRGFMKGPFTDIANLPYRRIE